MAVVRRRGKPAVTNYETERTYGDASVVRFMLESGRTHQIRVHSAFKGHPIIGDQTYGGREVRRRGLSGTRRSLFVNLLKDLSRQALHARLLEFDHPGTGRRVHFDSKLPADIRAALDRLDRAYGAPTLET
jgi:23S rRNA pseudouridine1911/1915/1917 synthase